MSVMRRSRQTFFGFVAVVAIVVGVMLGSAGEARADTLLTNWGPTGLGVITDGTSNTLLFTESTRMSFCFGGVGVRGSTGGANPIQDGTSNTIAFGESTFNMHVGFVSRRRPLTEIADGSSNTIIIGEIPLDDFCVGGVRPITEIGDGSSQTIEIGEGSTIDVCIDNARLQQIADGTSNTILIGEIVPRTCYSGVRVTDPPGAIAPEPATATLLLLGFGGAALVRRRRR